MFNNLYGDREMSKTKVLLLAIMLAFAPFYLFAQSSGKIVGVVKDKASGEPLPGVNISLDGTQYGAATDVDGFYVILNVPVGVYDVRASFVGYGEVVQTGVRVTADKTTEVNFTLEEATIEGQAVVITAEKPLVEKYTTQSVSLVTSEDLENIPVRGFNDVIATQNSVVVQDGNIHIRGGRDDEVGFYIDGASSVNPLSNTQSLYIIQEAVEEFQVLAGGYTAEFGGANAGIIRTELKTGSKDFKASIDFQTDKFASEGEKFLDTYSYRHHTGVATLSGPLFGDKVRFFVAGENTFKGDRAVRFSKGFDLVQLNGGPLIDQRSTAGANPDTINSYVYPDGFTPKQEEDLWALQGTLSFDLSPLTVRLSASYSDRTRQHVSGLGFFRTPMLDVLNNRFLESQFTNLLVSTKFTYVVNPKTIAEATVSFFNSEFNYSDSYFGEDWLKWYDSTAVAQHTNGAVAYRNAYRPRDPYFFSGFSFARDGDPVNNYTLRKQNYVGFALNLTSQMGRHHEVKFGGDYRGYKLRQFIVTPSAISLLGDNNVTDIKDIPKNAWVSNALPNNYGYDIYGNEADVDKFEDGVKVSQKPYEPVFAAFYVQDKIEYNDLIINAGLRYDYFDSKGRKFKDINGPIETIVDANTNQLLDDAFVDLDAFQHVSPRLGFSFPVTEKTVFYMQYGKFVQMPELETIYAGNSALSRQMVNPRFSFQNPFGLGLEPVRTTSYEIGFRQQISSVAAFDITGFYRNIKGQVQVDRVEPTNGLTPFNTLVNSDFATTKGMEFSLNLRRVNRIQAQLNYTLTQAEGTGSSRTSAVGALERETPRPTVISPLDYEQTHRGSVILDYRFGSEEGGPVFKNFGANMLIRFNSGHPYTFAKSEVGQSDAYASGVDYMTDPRSRRALEPVGSSRTPWNYNFDLRLDKTFKLMEDLQATVYMRVNNLFNTKNVINVYDATGLADDDGFYNNPNIEQRNSYLQQYGESWLNFYKTINIENGQAYWDLLGRELYGHPRQIFFGVKLSY
jgi:hypothetical protein